MSLRFYVRAFAFLRTPSLSYLDSHPSKCECNNGMRSIAKFVFELKPANLLKVTLLHGCFPRFLNCTTGIKSRKASLTCFKL